MDQTQQRKRKGLVGQQLHLQGKRHHMGKGWRQASVITEMAELAITFQLLRLDVQVTAQADLREGVTADLAFAYGAQIET
ncbi:hypothetical protein D3C72_2479140 [compost metagenome]